MVKRQYMHRMDIQVILFSIILVLVSSLSTFFVCYFLTYQNTIQSLTQRVYAVYESVENQLDKASFTKLTKPEDMDSQLYKQTQALLSRTKEATNLLYLYTATVNDEGDFIYQLDGLPLESPDFRRPGDPIEPEIVPELKRALAGEAILPSDIKPTEWGKIFIAYLPVHDADRKIVGVVGVEFDAESQYNTYFTLRAATPLIILLACFLAAFFSVLFFRRISNPTHLDLYNTDSLTELKSRHAFDTDFGNLNAVRSKQAVAVILADLNYLKRVNDQLGHQQGDDYLSAVGRIIRSLLPAKGVAYRIGGDEFAVILHEFLPSQAAAFANALAEHYLIQKPDWPVDTSIAVGWAVFEKDDDKDLYETFRRADKMLYKIKAEQHEKDGL